MNRKYYERLLVIAGIFLIFFVITMLSLPLLIDVLHIDAKSRDGLLFISVYQAVVMFIFASLLAARINSPAPASYLHLNVAPSWLGIVGVIFAYLIALPALNQIIYWNSNLTFPDSWAYWGETFREMEERAAEASNVMMNVSSIGAFVVNLVVIALITAFGEELFFRGTLQSAAASGGANHTAIWVVALIFSAMHFQFFGFVPRLLLGAWFGYLLYWSRSVYLPMIAHFINNGVVVLCAWLSNHYITINLDTFGVTEVGFPMPAFISALAFVIFVVYFKNFFFCEKKKVRRLYA